MKIKFFIFLSFISALSCTSFDLDIYNKTILESSGKNLQTILSQNNSESIECNNPDNYYLYTKLYIENFGFDKHSQMLLEKALANKNLFYNEAYDLYFRELIKNCTMHDVQLFLEKYQINTFMTYKNLLNYTMYDTDLENIGSINGDKDFSNLFINIAIIKISEWDLFKEYYFSYLFSIYNDTNKTLEIDLNKLETLTTISDSSYLKLIYTIQNNTGGITTKDIITALLEANTINHIKLIENLLINKQKRKEFETAITQLKNTSTIHQYSWVIYFRPFLGHNAIINDLDLLLNKFPIGSDEYYILQSYNLYSSKYEYKEYIKKVVEFSNNYSGLYHSYTLLSNLLREVLTNKTGLKYKDIFDTISLNDYNVTRNAVLYNLLNLIYPDENKWINLLKDKYPISYGSLRNGWFSLHSITENEKIKTSNFTGKGKQSLKKLNYYLKWDLKNDILNFTPVTDDAYEKAYLLSYVRDYLYKEENYYKAVSLSKQIASILYGSIFSAMDFETFNNLYPLHYKDIILKYSKEYGVDPAIVFAIMREESHYDKNIRSPVNAVGLMQIMPSTADWLSPHIGIKRSEIDLTNPDQNIKFGVYYIKFIMNRVYDTELIMAGYNAGHGRAIRWENEYKRLGKYEKYEYIPFEETRHYIRKVSQSYMAYKHILNEKKITMNYPEKQDLIISQDEQLSKSIF